MSTIPRFDSSLDSTKAFEDDFQKEREKFLEEYMLWVRIREKAKTDPGLNDLIEKVMVYYYIGRDNGIGS